MIILLFTGDERRVVASCLEEACFSDQGCMQTDLDGEKPLYQNEAGYYHPLALRALRVYFHDRGNTSKILLWDRHLHEYGKLKGTGESYRRMFKILGLQFSTFDRTTQLMLLDICLYASKALESSMLSNLPLEELIAWLANVHGEPTDVVRSKIFDLKKFSMITVKEVETIYKLNVLEVIVHDLYKEYATWFLGQVNNEEEVLGFWCVGKLGDLNSYFPLELQRTPPGWCWPDLKRIRLENIQCDGFPIRNVQEWCNVVGCQNVATIDLQGLTCLRHLELKYLWNLKTLTFTGDGNTYTNSVSQWTYKDPRQYLLQPLQFVTISRLSSPECLPSFSPFGSLKFLKVVDCKGWTQAPPPLPSTLLKSGLTWYPNQKTLPRLYGLASLRDLPSKTLALDHTRVLELWS